MHQIEYEWLDMSKYFMVGTKFYPNVVWFEKAYNPAVLKFAREYHIHVSSEDGKFYFVYQEELDDFLKLDIASMMSFPVGMATGSRSMLVVKIQNRVLGLNLPSTYRNDVMALMQMVIDNGGTVQEAEEAALMPWVMANI